MRLLITNDDGIDAPGLAALHQIAARLGEVHVYAPQFPLSGCSHRATTDGPIEVRGCEAGRHAVNGTPVDCVRIGLLSRGLDADWILSGINDGGNLGADTLCSGTVGAAREAALLGKRAIAISQYRRRALPFDWTWAARAVESILPHLLRRPLPARSFWNLNLPHESNYSAQVPELVFCPLDPHPLPISYEVSSEGLYYRSDYHARKRKLGCDVDVCFGGRAAVSLISLDPN